MVKETKPEEQELLCSLERLKISHRVEGNVSGAI
jgi:hypothetical protein